VSIPLVAQCMVCGNGRLCLRCTDIGWVCLQCMEKSSGYTYSFASELDAYQWDAEWRKAKGEL